MNVYGKVANPSTRLLGSMSAWVLIGALAASGQSRGSSSRVVAKHSGKCMEVSGKGFEDGATVWQSSCTGAPNQSFLFRHVVRDGYMYYEILAEQSGKCLEVAPSQPDLRQDPCNGGDAQLFQLNRDSYGDYEIVGKDGNLCVGVESFSGSDQARVTYDRCGAGDSQRWIVSLDPGK